MSLDVDRFIKSTRISNDSSLGGGLALSDSLPLGLDFVQKYIARIWSAHARRRPGSANKLSRARIIIDLKCGVIDLFTVNTVQTNVNCVSLVSHLATQIPDGLYSIPYLSMRPQLYCNTQLMRFQELFDSLLKW